MEKMPTRSMRKQQEKMKPISKSHSDWANTHKDGPVCIQCNFFIRSSRTNNTLKAMDEKNKVNQKASTKAELKFLVYPEWPEVIVKLGFITKEERKKFCSKLTRPFCGEVDAP